MMEHINISKKAFTGGLLLLVAGFVTMAAGSDTYSFLKITVAPVLILAAFATIAYAIMHPNRNSDV